ncbi:uncharacterized protein BDV14DRAFT_197683 [Aspergillus stella-maris]|uniref:uncharacterized protein n=1 Tax=Aspergillus stella-maris TaxID=1810926 RepID=UPI003CCE0C67
MAAGTKFGPHLESWCIAEGSYLRISTDILCYMGDVSNLRPPFVPTRREEWSQYGRAAFLAARMSRLEALEWCSSMMSHKGIPPLDGNGNGMCHATILSGNMRVVELCFSRYPDHITHNKMGHTAMGLAAKLGQVELVQKFVDMLRVAASEGQLEVLKCVLPYASEDVRSHGVQNASGLVSSCFHGHQGLFDYFLTHRCISPWAKEYSAHVLALLLDQEHTTFFKHCVRSPFFGSVTGGRRALDLALEYEVDREKVLQWTLSERRELVVPLQEDHEIWQMPKRTFSEAASFLQSAAEAHHGGMTGCDSMMDLD